MRKAGICVVWMALGSLTASTASHVLNNLRAFGDRRLAGAASASSGGGRSGRAHVIMRRLILFVLIGLSAETFSRSAEAVRKPLKDAAGDLKSHEGEQTRKYKWTSLIRKGSKTETNDYALLVVSTKIDNDKLQLHDTIELVPRYNGLIFDRRINYPRGNLLAPEEIILDITGPSNTVRQLRYEKGEATFITLSGKTNSQRWTFDDGILSFNALLRLAPLLPREIGNVYTFQAYAEPFLFRVREAEKKDEPFTLTCEGPETVTIDKKSYECVRFKLELKSAEVRTDIWVGTNNVVVKFLDTMPKRANAEFLQATLEE